MVDRFEPTTDEEIKKIVMKSKIGQCSLYPIPINLVKEYIDALVPVMTKIVSLSLLRELCQTVLEGSYYSSSKDVNDLHELGLSSYRKFHSCETALIRVQNDIIQTIDGKKCDLSAAFDTVDHKKLLQTT